MNQVSQLQTELKNQSYIIDEGLVSVLYIALMLPKPLLVEGPAGVGKTEMAKSLAKVLGRKLVRLQCYEGIDESRAIYEWDYPRQLLRLQGGLKDQDWNVAKGSLYTEEFLLCRPLLEALQSEQSVVLLIDEVDKADDAFEALLLEILAEYQVTIPELGTVKAKQPPIAILTSNSTRDLGDALRRRCLHVYLNYPAPERELEILSQNYPQTEVKLARQIVAMAQILRREKLRKAPSVAETLDWLRALGTLEIQSLEDPRALLAASALLKYEEDHQKLTAYWQRWLTLIAADGGDK